MKRIIATLLTLLLVFSLAACGNNGENPNDDPLSREDGTTQGGQENPGTQGGENNNGGGNNNGGENNNGGGNNNGGNTSGTTDIDIGSIIGGSSSTVWGKQDEVTKQQIIAEGKKDGVDISFGADGSMTVVDPEKGDTIIQNPDGTWTVKDEDGTIGQYGGQWPENEFTKLLPKPEFELTGSSTNEDEFAVLFQNVTVDQIRDYVEKVKANGFTVEALLTDQEVMGMVIYTYEAKNSADYTVTVTFTGGVSGLTVQKP